MLYSNSLNVQTRKGRGSSGTQVLQKTDDVPFPRNFLDSFLCSTDNKHDSGLYLASKIVSIYGDVGNTHLLLCATHDKSVISFPPTVNCTVFQISSTARKLIKKLFDMLFIVQSRIFFYRNTVD